MLVTFFFFIPFPILVAGEDFSISSCHMTADMLTFHCMKSTGVTNNTDDD